MADYALYYWPVPFRGQPIRAVLAHVGASWDEVDFEAINALKSQSPDRSPVNIRPVRLAPWAAGAKPTTKRRAGVSPKPGTGRPQ